MPDYLKSSALHLTVLIQCISFYKLLTQDPELLYKAFEKSIPINFALTIIALMLRFAGNTSMWQTALLGGTSAFANIPRLRLFTYEPSYYSTLFAPIILFYILRFSRKIKANNLFILGLLGFSMLLSLSFGVITTLIITLIVVNVLSLNNKTIAVFFISTVVFLVAGSLFVIVNPNNAFIVRLVNVFSGNDVSGNARLFDSWSLAWQILQKNHGIMVGIGWGQLKIVGHDIIQAFYHYTDDQTSLGYTLPNFVCELLAIVGVIGTTIYFLMLFYFYRKTGVKKSIYRKYIFWFIFIYQFTGSYSSSVIHYALLIIAFYPPVDNYFVKYKNAFKRQNFQSNNLNQGIPEFDKVVTAGS